MKLSPRQQEANRALRIQALALARVTHGRIRSERATEISAEPEPEDEPEDEPGSLFDRR